MYYFKSATVYIRTYFFTYYSACSFLCKCLENTFSAPSSSEILIHCLRSLQYKHSIFYIIFIFTPCIFLLQMFDGWVLKGEKFPSRQDHQLPLHQRYTDYCSSTAGTTSRSSQNVAMIFFRIHSPDSGFTLAVKKLHNPFRESRHAPLKSLEG